jgi:hypothetical protein
LWLLLAGVAIGAIIWWVTQNGDDNFGEFCPDMIESWIQYSGDYYRFGIESYSPEKRKRKKYQHPYAFLWFENNMITGNDTDPDERSHGWKCGGGGWSKYNKEHDGTSTYNLTYDIDNEIFYINNVSYPLAKRGNVFLIFRNKTAPKGVTVSQLVVDLSNVSIQGDGNDEDFYNNGMANTRAGVEAFAIHNVDVVAFFEQVNQTSPHDRLPSKNANRFPYNEMQ